MSQLVDPEIAVQLTRIANALEKQLPLLEQIAQSNVGQWECCMNGTGASTALLKVSLQHYDKNPAERFELYQQEISKKE